MSASLRSDTLDPVIFLHGQPGTGRDWDRVVAALHERARTIVLDRPGWDGRTSATDLPGNASFALTALDLADVERAIVVGHSFGGAVAAWLAAWHPDRVTALVLAAPAANLASLYKLDRVLATPVLGNLLGAATLAGPAVAFGVGPMRREIASRLALDETYLREAGRTLRSPRAWRSFVVEQRAMLDGLPVLEPQLGAITAPTMIVIGRRDRVVPPASARRLAGQIGSSSLVIVDRAGHLLPLRQAPRLAEAIVAVGAAAAERRSA
ncbi:MAG TPA: alpha/beta hydrolase [Solirubrobacteraceae bacterium]|nr:alpha/beta hydrolase [Solirubrobacteraceae bacterium]